MENQYHVREITELYVTFTADPTTLTWLLDPKNGTPVVEYAWTTAGPNPPEIFHDSPGVFRLRIINDDVLPGVYGDVPYRLIAEGNGIQFDNQKFFEIIQPKAESVT